MRIETIAIDKLRDHPANANVMSEATLAKLARHIAATGQYEPLAVRRHPREPGCFELINGHHRRKALQQLGRTEAACVVWDVTDEQALMLLATLNRLTGHDDLTRRARLLEQLGRSLDLESLTAALPETRERVEKLLALNRPPEPAKPESADRMLKPMCFFVTDRQRAIIDEALQQARDRIGGDDPDGRVTRGDLLACLADAALGNGDKTGE